MANGAKTCEGRVVWAFTLALGPFAFASCATPKPSPRPQAIAEAVFSRYIIILESEGLDRGLYQLHGPTGKLAPYHPRFSLEGAFLAGVCPDYIILRNYLGATGVPRAAPNKINLKDGERTVLDAVPQRHVSPAENGMYYDDDAHHLLYYDYATKLQSRIFDLFEPRVSISEAQFTHSSEGKSIYCIGQDAHISKLDPAGNEITQMTLKAAGVSVNLTDDYLLIYHEHGKRLFNCKTEKTQSVDSNLGEAVWTPDGDFLILYEFAPTGRELSQFPGDMSGYRHRVRVLEPKTGTFSDLGFIPSAYYKLWIVPIEWAKSPLFAEN